ncbi:carboxylate--amine ligase [Natronocalculus amylovorans]|uniref:Carboxylate--amine ligase n=1 Tax=Natronocalculus amylovorans TaxID=2917812 RepID=A0AAE3K9X0_9EURY|nr:carboxylate--amine ligase [Natronocalculus amylovorans]MCL9816464.1 carboxylate--amine ligase [Natronocalculus amylovorans]
MADSFLSTDALIDTLSAHSFDRPPALVSNAHITGVSVARALSAHDIPVIALDRNGDGVAPPSNAIDFAGEVTFPLTDLDGFRTDVEAIVDAAGGEAVAFGCMDEWVHAYAESEPEGVHLPFAAYEIVDRVLDKSSLYRIADELGVPYPETYWLDETDVDEAVDALSFPLVVKPALKREFEEAFGTNVVEVTDRKELDSLLAEASGADIEVLLQERVPIVQGKDRSLASYVPPATENPAVGDVADALAVVGNARVRYPQAFGTSCVVDRVSHPEIEARALAVLAETGYYGISEAEFVYDGEREEYVLLDINTRPWKWISMPVAAGANLPLAAYADAVSDDSLAPSETPIEETRWVYLRDYLSLLATNDAFWDVLSDAQWQSLVSGSFEDTAGVTTGVYRPSDPAPAVKLINTEFTDREYYCSC